MSKRQGADAVHSMASPVLARRSSVTSSPRENRTVSRTITGLCACVLAAALAGGCANTVKGAQKDTEKAVEKTAGGVNTADVKSALIADGRVDASNINVDTVTNTKTVVLKGTVPTAQQKTIAEQIARDKAKGYTVQNQLTVAPAKAG